MSISRKVNQSLVITVPPSSEPTEVVVEVRDVRGNTARLKVYPERLEIRFPKVEKEHAPTI